MKNVLYKNKEKKGSQTMNQVEIKIELQNNSQSDVVADTQETS